jgi:hypothetical protein
LQSSWVVIRQEGWLGEPTSSPSSDEFRIFRALNLVGMLAILHVLFAKRLQRTIVAFVQPILIDEHLRLR